MFLWLEVRYWRWQWRAGDKDTKAMGIVSSKQYQDRLTINSKRINPLFNSPGFYAVESKVELDQKCFPAVWKIEVSKISLWKWKARKREIPEHNIVYDIHLGIVRRQGLSLSYNKYLKYLLYEVGTASTVSTDTPTPEDPAACWSRQVPGVWEIEVQVSSLKLREQNSNLGLPHDKRVS